jgi:hypothetical protein
VRTLKRARHCDLATSSDEGGNGKGAAGRRDEGEWSTHQRDRLGCRLGLDEQRVRTRASKVALDAVLKLQEYLGVDVELQPEIQIHFVLHLVDLPELKHMLGNDAPPLVGAHVVANNLGGEHVHRG